MFFKVYNVSEYKHCSFVEPKHLSVDANIYAQVEAKCLSIEETQPVFEAKYSCVDEKHFDL